MKARDLLGGGGEEYTEFKIYVGWVQAAMKITECEELSGGGLKPKRDKRRSRTWETILESRRMLFLSHPKTLWQFNNMQVIINNSNDLK